jgi:NAD(P)H-hydrate epimerase
VLDRLQVREIDQRAIREYGMSSLVLMENAGRGCADVLERLGVGGLVVIACGRGNNGGDGHVVARHLDLRAMTVRVLYWDDPAQFTPDCLANFRILERAEIDLRRLPPGPDPTWDEAFAGADWCVDALLGTGASGEPREPYASAIRWMNGCPARRLAIDWPSGLDCDTGEAASTTFRADHTCTFVAAKSGLRHPGAAAFVGQWHVVDIGVPRQLLREYLP